jgi:hypothetical protein
MYKYTYILLQIYTSIHDTKPVAVRLIRPKLLLYILIISIMELYSQILIN